MDSLFTKLSFIFFRNKDEAFLLRRGETRITFL